ncbi:MAG: iron ABC transporter substrate-binding protein [Dehalococcoidia bacterium]
MTPHRLRTAAGAALAFGALLTGLLVAACGGDDDGGDNASVVVYSGRSQTLVESILVEFENDTGIKVLRRYGDTSGLAGQILEEGKNSPADVFFAQDAGALGALASEDMLATLPDSLLNKVAPAFRSPDGVWIGISGRARTVVYNTDRLSPEDLPDSILDFTDPQWKGRIGWAPTNASFQAFVTGMRVLLGDDAARDWLEGIKANDPIEYPNNSTIVQAVADGEVDVGFVNHYYLYRFLSEHGEGFKARNYFMAGGDPGALVNIAGAGILKSAKNKEAAERLIEYLLSEKAQRYFAEETFEYPLAAGVAPSVDIPPLAELEPPDLDLSDLADLRGTIELLRETGVLP